MAFTSVQLLLLDSSWTVLHAGMRFTTVLADRGVCTVVRACMAVCVCCVFELARSHCLVGSVPEPPAPRVGRTYTDAVSFTEGRHGDRGFNLPTSAAIR